MFAAISDPVLIAAIAAVSSAIASVLALVKAQSTHRIVNSRMSELLALAKTSSRAEGVKEGEDSAKVTSAITPPLTEARLIELLEARDKAKKS